MILLQKAEVPIFPMLLNVNLLEKFDEKMCNFIILKLFIQNI
jgi:hypothetical protein